MQAAPEARGSALQQQGPAPELMPGPGGMLSRVAITTSSGSRFTAVPAPVMSGIYAIGPVAVLPGGRIITVQTQEDRAPVAWYSDDGGAHWVRTLMTPDP